MSAAGWATARGRSAEPTSDAALVRRTRRRLLLWSGGSTLVVLVALGALLYAAVANSLAAAATDQLRERAQMIAAGTARATLSFESPFGIARTPGDPGVLIGGASSGTIAFVTTANGQLIGGSRPFSANTPVGALIDDADIAEAAATGHEVVGERTVAGTGWRLLTVPVAAPQGTLVVQVVGDRAAEERTLGVVLAVLVVGGLAALAASLVVGRMYADRALVPVRDAMRRQREFAADASHELRTPLAVVKGSVADLRRHRDQPVADVGNAIDDIEAGTDRLTALVDDLLMLARTDSGAAELEPAPTDLGDLAIDAVGGLAGVAAERGVRLEIDAEPVPLVADAARLRQLVVILVDNAIRHAAAGRRTVAVAVRGFDGRAVLTVDDDGPGIGPDDLPHVFDRFWRAPNAPKGGTGLGLSIAQWIVDRHGGSIAAANRPGGGARFEVRLPRDTATNLQSHFTTAG
jgi:two-component system, OmpR family, sensor histidine kinase CiaH